MDVFLVDGYAVGFSPENRLGFAAAGKERCMPAAAAGRGCGKTCRWRWRRWGVGAVHVSLKTIVSRQ